MKRLTIAIGLVLVLSAVPATSAEHLSVGVQDGPVAQKADETPDNPSVPGGIQGADGTPYGVGTKTSCDEFDGNLSQSEVQAATSGDGFCGDLVYHDDSVIGPVKSTPDQHLLDDKIGRFDVIHTNSFRTMTPTGVARDVTNLLGLGDPFCIPMCPSGHPMQPAGGDALFDEFHNAGSQLGLTHEADEARDRAPNDRTQQYAANAYVLGPGRTVQDVADVWRMDGWMMPAVEDSWIAFLEEPAGQDTIAVDSPGDNDLATISDAELEALVDARSGKSLHPSSAPRVCMYSSDVELTTIAPGAAGTKCELPFRYRGAGSGEIPGAGEEANFKDGYNDRCESPTYVCGAAMGPAWYSEFCVCFGGLFSQEGNQRGYYVWHMVVAPHNSDCGGTIEPTFSFDGGGFDPYLAHEVDVYTPPTDVQGQDRAHFGDDAFDYEESILDRVEDQGLDTVEQIVDDAISQVPDLPGPVEETVDQASETATDSTFLVQKSDRVEPNHAGTVAGLADTSQSKESGSLLERTFDDPCTEFRSSEDADTLDDWVDIIDAEPRAVHDYEHRDLAFGAIAEEDIRAGAYDNADENQDDANRPGPSLYQTTGKVGMFTDVDDDGEYDQVESGQKYETPTTVAEGAYPMIWDMVLESSGKVDPDGGCAPSAGQNLVKTADNLGYGPNTGLVQAIYLNEPSAFVNPGSDEVAAFPVGNNIYLLMSQAARVQYEPGIDDDNPLDTEIENLVENLKTYADANNGDLDAPDVRLPAEELGLQDAFQPQCSGPTGEFDGNVRYLHQCETDCSGDTIATMYTFELDDGTLQGANLLPDFQPTGNTAYDFGAGQHTWIDVDPFDGDPDRNTDQSSAPPTADN